MKIRDKYPKFKDERFLEDMISRAVYSSMALENQIVPMHKIRRFAREHKQKMRSTYTI